ncbi:hypothetical protein [Actinacidiphila acidipaludis]|uniref:Uncharacterized protein n=1 Tax=Actinacidiphila acidipaludis TaxID=2873382 RepID=A0ABS7QJE6_9ACTN|nr:hypothetical protein [Streptomyces acidipaludis]MBY8882555.1 hypothetical protein [Streptomyces acidipaludis]
MSVFGRVVAFVRDSVSGRRRLARYADPEAHRRGPNVRDSRVVEEYRGRDLSRRNDLGPFSGPFN